MIRLKENIRLNVEDIDDAGNIRPGRLLYYFQEIAADHAARTNIGYDDLIADNRIWVLSKVKYRITAPAAAGTEYSLQTYPRGKKGVTYLRDYYLLDGSGERIAVGESHWCVINFATRKVERADLPLGDDLIKTKAIPEGIEKIRLTEPEYAKSHIVTPEDLDVNEHTNNCRYADMIDEITGRSDYREFTIHFARESRLGDEIMLYRQRSDDGEIFMGRFTDGTVLFQAKVVY